MSIKNTTEAQAYFAAVMFTLFHSMFSGTDGTDGTDSHVERGGAREV